MRKRMELGNRDGTRFLFMGAGQQGFLEGVSMTHFKILLSCKTKSEQPITKLGGTDCPRGLTTTKPRGEHSQTNPEGRVERVSPFRGAPRVTCKRKSLIQKVLARKHILMETARDED